MADENANSQAQAAQEPQDIASAFQMVRENQQAATQPVGQEKQAVQGEAGTQTGSGGTGEDRPVAVPGPGDLGSEPQVPVEPAIGGGAENLGGSPAPEPQADYAALQNNLISALQDEAQRNVFKKFKENNIKMMDVGDLYERREDGTVVFNNPDDPNRPFDTRADAQDWIDSMNKQIQNAFQQEVYKEQQDLYNKSIPMINLLQFAPVYDAMDTTTQQVFDDLIEPYSLMNQQGEVVGFDCDLASMARQAMQIVERYGIGKSQPQQATQQAAPQQSTPAMDLKSGSGTSVDDREPTDIAEAMSMLNRQRKEKKNG